MKKFKKIAALILALAMSLSLCAGITFADDTTVPSSSDTVTTTVYGVSSGTVTAYQIVAADYSTYGITGYSAVTGVTIADIENITADEATDIAKDIIYDGITLTSVVLTAGEDSYTGSLGAGVWILLVTDVDDAVVYNPMIVSNYYADASDASSLTAGSVNADGNFVEGENVIYAKSSSPASTFDKTIVAEDDEQTAVSGSSINVGDSVTFQITVTIPDYSDAFVAAVFDITDTLSSGFDLPSSSDVIVTVGGSSVSISGNTYAFTSDSDSNSFTISFNSAYILNHGGQEVVITYTVDTNEKFSTDVTSAETNSASLTYTTSATPDDPDADPDNPDPSDYPTETIPTDDPDDEDDPTPTTDYIYTFSINGEIKKVNVSDQTLSGAEFSIFTDEDCTEAYSNSVDDGVVTTSNDGLVTFTGLAEGTYYITETYAPEGYYVNDTVYTVVIAADYNTDGTLNYYTVTVSDDGGNSATSTYTLIYGETVTISSDVTVTSIVDSTQQTLPSTGGIGLYVVIGISVLILGLGVFAVTKKRSRNEA